MGVMQGYRQVSLYVEPTLYDQAGHVAKMLGEPMYEFVSKALALAIKSRTTPEQRKAIELLSGPTPSPKAKKKEKK